MGWGGDLGLNSAPRPGVRPAAGLARARKARRKRTPRRASARCGAQTCGDPRRCEAKAARRRLLAGRAGPALAFGGSSWWEQPPGRRQTGADALPDRPTHPGPIRTHPSRIGPNPGRIGPIRARSGPSGPDRAHLVRIGPIRAGSTHPGRIGSTGRPIRPAAACRRRQLGVGPGATRPDGGLTSTSESGSSAPRAASGLGQGHDPSRREISESSGEITSRFSSTAGADAVGWRGPPRAGPAASRPRCPGGWGAADPPHVPRRAP